MLTLALRKGAAVDLCLTFDGSSWVFPRFGSVSSSSVAIPLNPTV